MSIQIRKSEQVDIEIRINNTIVFTQQFTQQELLSLVDSIKIAAQKDVMTINGNKSWADMVEDCQSKPVELNIPKPVKIKDDVKEDFDFRYMLECPDGDNCQYAIVWEDDCGIKRRKCQYLHNDEDCKFGSRFCENIEQCAKSGKIHGC